MKNPETAMRAGAFRVAMDASLNTYIHATSAPVPAIPKDQRFRWCPLSNSVQTVKIRKGTIEHD